MKLLSILVSVLVIGALVAGCGSTGTSPDAGPPVPDATADDGGGDAGACAPAEVVCGGECVDVSRDSANCGGCGRDCAALGGVSSASCSEGACVIGECADGRADCDGDASNGCEVDITSATDCGGCGVACEEPTPLCSVDDSGAAACANDCGGATPARCAESCVDTDTDPDHCGGCDMACPAVANAERVCAGGTCDFACSFGFLRCGDGCVPADAGTFCDDDNAVDGDGCSATCAVEPGFACTGEPAVCTAVCGDGLVAGAESCDDMNQVTETCAYGETSCSVCDASCQTAAGATSFCGDTVTDAANGEACDDGNTTTEPCLYGETSCSVCDASCQTVAGVTSFCGDSVTDAANGEACDDGNATTEPCLYGETSCTVCDASCQSVPGATSVCGDSVIDAASGETCDDGNTTTEICAYGETCTVCDASCQSVPGATSVCGDGRIDVANGEVCDDGGRLAGFGGGTGAGGDGCSATCTEEPGFSCRTVPTLVGGATLDLSICTRALSGATGLPVIPPDGANVPVTATIASPFDDRCVFSGAGSRVSMTWDPAYCTSRGCGHTWASDLVIRFGLNGSFVTLHRFNHGANDLQNTYTFADDAAIPWSSVGAVGGVVPVGTYRPVSALSGLDGLPASGSFTLDAADGSGLDTGRLSDFTAEIRCRPN